MAWYIAYHPGVGVSSLLILEEKAMRRPERRIAMVKTPTSFVCCLSWEPAGQASQIMMRNIITFQTLVGIFFGVACFSSCAPVNVVGDPHFTEDGHYIVDSSKVTFKSEIPSGITFFMETSGSMNGFLRANRPTDFKEDVWRIASSFGSRSVNIFEGEISNVPIATFQRKMNSGLFLSPVSTQVPIMLETILDNVDFNAGNVAVLISDMKYDPVGNEDIKVRLTQYSTDVMNIVARHKGISYSLIGAYSDYLDRNGNVLVANSPYYYLIIGQDKYLPELRNSIITLLQDRGKYIDDAEIGFDYKTPAYEFGNVENAIPLDDGEPSFVGFDADTCKITLKIDISDCRWAIADEKMLESAITVSSGYGSSVKIGTINVDVENHFNKELRRKAVASVELCVYDMLTDADVIEWTMSYPDKRFSEEFTNIINNANPNDIRGSFSVNNFIGGLFGAEQNHWDETPNYILISKKQ